MKSIGRRATIAIAAVAGLAVLIGGWFLLIQPTRSSIAKTKSETATQEQSNQSAQLELQSMRSIAKNLPAEQAELAALQEKVPNEVELPSILRSMQALAKTSGVTLLTIAPTTPSPLSNAPGISVVNISMSVVGGYAEVEQFDSALEGLQRTFLVSGFSLTGSGTTTATTSGSSTSSSSPTDSVNVTANLSGSVLVKTPAATATTATGH